MKINLEITPVVGGFKINAEWPKLVHEAGTLDGLGRSEGFAGNWKYVPTRIKVMLASIPEPTS